jgi:hypothetical protein
MTVSTQLSSSALLQHTLERHSLVPKASAAAVIADSGLICHIRNGVLILVVLALRPTHDRFLGSIFGSECADTVVWLLHE